MKTIDTVDPVLTNAAAPRRYYIKTFGCQMNEADTQRMSALLEDQGMRASSEPDQADVILINGCSVREKAVHKAVSALGEYVLLKKAQQKSSGTRGPVIGLGGCVGQLEKDKLFSRVPVLDFVFGPDAIDQLPEMIYRVDQGERKLLFTEFDPTLVYSTTTRTTQASAQAFVNIMKGCDKFCTYCIVPFTRGKEKSRTIQEVLDDVAALVGQGVREVTLLGQNVNSFGKGNVNSAGFEPQELFNQIGKVGPRQGEENFPQLLRAMDCDPRLAELKRIRFTSSHPLDFSDQLIACYAKPEAGGVAKLAPHLHLPVQSGSDRILQKMGRHHKIQTYIDQMDRLRELNPDIGVSTDLIVGFPTETEEDFEATLKLLDRVQYDGIYAFAYSPRPGTRAFKLEDDVSLEDKRRRLNQVLQYQRDIGEKRNQKLAGRKMEVLVEGLSKNQNLAQAGLEVGVKATDRVWTGRTGCSRVVNFTATSPRDLTGRFLEIEIVAATSLSLHGRWVAPHEVLL